MTLSPLAVSLASFIIGILVTCMLVALYRTRREAASGSKTQDEQLKWFIEHLLHYRGETDWNDTGWYHLQTFDAGHHWVAIDREGQVLGDADEIWPGLLERLIDLETEYDEPLSLQWYQGHYRREQGCSPMHGVLWYEFLSIDGGRNWVAVDHDGSILGEVEDVYPGFRAKLAGLRSLADHVEKHGAIGSQEMTPEDAAHLAAAGFTVSLSS
ncbi:MAG: hypothetical protein ABIB97_01695 [Patescibacteria group bacterium]